MASPDLLQRELKWLGSPTVNHFGTITEIRGLLPTFVRRPFSTVSVDGANDLPSNAFLDVIVRTPLNEGDEEIPVGVVSKQYQLVQHAEVLDKAIEAIKKAGIAPEKVKADLTITKYGERVGLHLQFPEEYGLDPGDGHRLALRLGCFNSVDGSTKFRAVLGWIRFVCSNGMIVGSARTDFRSRHTQSLQVEGLYELLEDGIDRAIKEKDNLQRWVKTPLGEQKLVEWVDGPLAKKWGIKAATRAFHIARKGKDVHVVPFTEKLPPSEKEVEFLDAVPGSSEAAKNLYAVSQVLTWLAGQRSDIEEQLSWQRDVPDLMMGLAG
ncbi:MAG: hypothetical protein C0617_03620 [Desulfuromonas sp.]|uniref:DUF932 domain-containing protein n=1 Tax=Desulfuromonas sp. TaxID=892 RepID=UPI000CAE81DF|nr:DUF932 domain-containing protein [Desulfuromonas sp.]PLX85596.1 MAG: hypothetical protein C0617_03620 [Desulfuromonas sp.]